MNNKKIPLRLVIYRPHTHVWFKRSIQHLLIGRHYPAKYEPLLDWMLKSDIKISFSTTLVRSEGLKGLILYILNPIALLIWTFANNISINRVNFVFTKKQLLDNDVLFFMHYGNFTNEHIETAKYGRTLAENLKDFKIFKLGHMTHYQYNSKIGSDNLSTLKPDLLIAENNLQRNSKYFNYHFSNITLSFECLPYVASDRFHSIKPFTERLNKLIATGTLTYKIKDQNFEDFFHTDELQPFRRVLYNNAHFYPKQIDSIISDLNAERQKDENIKVGLFGKLRKFLSKPQKDYYKKDLLDIYNSYMMFTVTEEISDLPAIGFVEGMACGCVFIGLENVMYTDLGLIPGVHYVTYDGSFDDFISKVRFYQRPENISKLEIIAENGNNFVNKNFRADHVYSNFFNKIIKQ